MQPGATAAALNRIFGLDPSIIQGKITANGQIYLINQNGILFDRGAQINVRSLVASTLNITNERFLSGALAGGGLSTPAFSGGYDNDGRPLPARPDGTAQGAINIGSSGTAAAAPHITAVAGGAILLFAPKIDNAAGIISSPDGQVILAAGSTAYLALPTDGASTLRGFQVEVTAPQGQDVNLTSVIRNLGSISADRGNVTLAALAINQAGRVSATTAIQSSGSIYLQARTKDNAQAGSVVLGAGSATQVLPDSTGHRDSAREPGLHRPARADRGRRPYDRKPRHAAGARRPDQHHRQRHH